MKKALGCFLIVFGCSTWVVQADPTKAREVVAAAIEAMGGKSYLEVRNAHSTGQYFSFDDEGRKGYAKYEDWTVLQPIKWRFQLGQGKRASVQIFNLEVGKGWTLEGRDYVEEAKPEAIDEFRKGASRSEER